MKWLIPIHCNLREVESVVKPSHRVIHVGIGFSIVELLWSAKMFKEIHLTDIDLGKLSLIAGFVKRHLKNVKVISHVEARIPDVSLNYALKVLRDLRSGYGLKPFPKGFRVEVISIYRLNILDMNFKSASTFDYVFSFGYSEILAKEETKIAVFDRNLREMVRDGGTIILSDILAGKNLREELKRNGLYTQIGEHTLVYINNRGDV